MLGGEKERGSRISWCCCGWGWVEGKEREEESRSGQERAEWVVKSSFGGGEQDWISEREVGDGRLGGTQREQREH